jgi:hypothetical protein
MKDSEMSGMFDEKKQESKKGQAAEDSKKTDEIDKEKEEDKGIQT